MLTWINESIKATAYHNCTFAQYNRMAVKLIVVLVLFSQVIGHDAADMAIQNGSGLLQQAIKYLVNYTASEAKTRLDMQGIGSTVAAIAFQELTEKLGRYISIFTYINSTVPLITLPTQVRHIQGIVMITKDYTSLLLVD